MNAYTQKDYEAIEAAVLESPRGRWFLGEFARRNRAADTVTLLEAIRKLERGRWFLGEFARRNRAADTLMLLEAIRKLERGVAETPGHRVSGELAAELQDASETIASTIDRGACGDELDRAIDRLARVKEKLDELIARHSDTGEGELTGENLSFFAGDEDLFEPAPAASAPSLSVVGEAQERSLPARAASEAPKGDPKDRIVFIRRGSSKETSIPLADEAEPAGQSRS